MQVNHRCLIENCRFGGSRGADGAAASGEVVVLKVIGSSRGGHAMRVGESARCRRGYDSNLADADTMDKDGSLSWKQT